MTVDEYIDELDSPMKEISKELRRIIKDFSPELTEEIKWNVPTYSMKKNICSIMAHKNHVNFQIMQGAYLADAQQLEGTGKAMRHIKIAALVEVDETTITRYLSHAVELDS